MNSKEKDEYVNQAMERMTSMEPYYCNPFDNPKELKERASDLLKRLNSLGDNAQEEKESIMRQLFGTYNKLAFPGDGFKCDYGFNIHVGDNFYANYGCVILDSTKVTIGDHVFLGPNVQIYTPCHPIYAPARNEGYEYAKEVTIGDDVWVGGNVTIVPGAHIGSNVVIGAGSVVTGDIPDGVVAAGNPCRIIRKITDQDKQNWLDKKEKE